MQHKNNEEHWSWKHYFVPLTTLKVIHGIAIIGFIVYGNILFNGFALDDKTLTVLNPYLHNISFETVFGAGVNDSAGLYRPIQTLYFAIIYPDVPFVYHFWQLVLQIVNTILLYIFFQKFFNKTLSILLALIFLVHPTQVESISYVAASTNQLFFLFGITALLLGLDKHVRVKRLSYITLLLVLSMFSREIGILFIFMLIGYRFIFRKGKVLQFIIAGISAILIYAIMRFSIGGVYPDHTTLIPITNLPLVERLVHIPAIIFYYLKTFFYPSELAVMQYWTIANIDFLNFYFPLIIISLFFGTIILFSFYLRKVNNSAFLSYMFFFLWFLVGLAPHVQIFPLDATVADRWFYFPMVGLLGILGVGIQSSTASQYRVKKIVYILLLIIIVILSARTVVRNTNWADILTLYLHDSKLHNNFIIENNIGTEYAQKGQYQEALKHDLKSISMLPYEGNLYNAGLEYERLGDIQKAREYYEKALASGVRYTKNHKHELFLYERVGLFLLLYDKPETANKFLKEAVADYPNAGLLWSLFAVSESKLGNHEKALEYAAKGAKLTPNKGTIYTYKQLLNKQEVELSPF